MADINIFVLGADEFNFNHLRSLPVPDQYCFHTLLNRDTVKDLSSQSFKDILDEADQRLRDFDGHIHAIVGYWDFPVSSIIPLLCTRFGVPGPSPDSMLKCEHKYWSRLEQKKVIPEACPRFQVINPEDKDAVEQIEVPYPCWIKPVKATASELSFKLENLEQATAAVEKARKGMPSSVNAFADLLNHVYMPPDTKSITGSHCLVESAMTGRQFTACGYVSAHRIYIYGIVESINYAGTSSFLRYEYPARIPEDAKQKMVEISRKIMHQIGFNDGAFNIEYFYDEDTGAVGLLEINPRISQSHGYVFEFVDGAANHCIMLDTALARVPDPPHREGPYDIAAKWFVKHFSDAYVKRVPTEKEIKEIENELDGVVIHLTVREGMHLHDLIEQDPSSFELAHIHVGAKDEVELKNKFEAVRDRLQFELLDVQGEP